MAQREGRGLHRLPRGNNYTFTAANTDCYGCHMAPGRAPQRSAERSESHHRGFPNSQCATCHDTLLWAMASSITALRAGRCRSARDHACASCTWRQRIRPYFGEHGLLWMPSGGLVSTQTLGGQVPNHIAAQFSTSCVTCHTTWSHGCWGRPYLRLITLVPHSA